MCPVSLLEYLAPMLQIEHSKHAYSQGGAADAAFCLEPVDKNQFPR